MNKKMIKFLEDQDWSGLARAHEQMERVWHANEWKEFIHEATRREVFVAKMELLDRFVAYLITHENSVKAEIADWIMAEKAKLQDSFEIGGKGAYDKQ